MPLSRNRDALSDFIPHTVQHKFIFIAEIIVFDFIRDIIGQHFQKLDRSFAANHPAAMC